MVGGGWVLGFEGFQTLAKAIQVPTRVDEGWVYGYDA